MKHLLQDLKEIVEAIPGDMGGGSRLEKTCIMSYLASKYRFRTYVEIGVYRGRSFFPLAHTFKQNGGMAYGIDPYSTDAARENDVAPAISKAVNDFIETLDFGAVYRDVEGLRSKFNVLDSSSIIRKTSADAVGFFRDGNISIGMLHIDGNHDTKFVTEDVELYSPLVVPDGIVVMDDIDWDSVKPAYAVLKERMSLIMEDADYAVLLNRKPGGDLSALRFEAASVRYLIGMVTGRDSWIGYNIADMNKALESIRETIEGRLSEVHRANLELERETAGLRQDNAGLEQTLSSLGNDLAIAKAALEDKTSQYLRAQAEIKVMRKNIGWKIFRELERFKERFAK